MDSVTVQTVQDLEKDIALAPKRKNTSKACESCRKLKIRCQEPAIATNDSTCQHCLKLGYACSWPQEDARKRTKTRLNDRHSQKAQAAEAANHESEPPDDSLQPCLLASSHSPDHNSSPFSAALEADPTPRTATIPYTVLQYHRYLGSTAIVPGYKKVSLKVADDHSGPDQQNGAPHSFRDQRCKDLFDDDTNLPAASLISHLLDAFFEYYGSNFCFLNRAQLEKLIHTKEISSFLLCSMGALSARFCNPGIFATYFAMLPDGRQRERWEYTLPFLVQAKKLLMPLLSIPSSDLVAGLLFLALAEFGNNNEAGETL